MQKDGRDEKSGQDKKVLDALEIARANRAQSTEALSKLVKIPSLTGEEGVAQEYMTRALAELGGEVLNAEPDIEALFVKYPKIAQYPTHWKHDLILPYSDLPTYESLVKSGLLDILNYDSRPNVTSKFAGSGGGRSLILNGHIDTVTLGDLSLWTKEPFGAEEVEGVMFGRGTSDMKGGLMAAMLAIKYIKEAGIRLKGDLIYQSVVNEEHSGNGTLDIVRRGCNADAAIVLEPTQNQVFSSNPGGLYWDLRIPGVPRSPAARWDLLHGLGVSAVEKLPQFINGFLELEERYNRDPKLVGYSTENKPFSFVIGKVNGGNYETATAELVTMRGSIYFAPQVGDVVEVMNSLKAVVDSCNSADDFLREHPAKLSFLHHDDASSWDGGSRIAACVLDATRSVGGKAEVSPAPFCCDMRHLVNRASIPTVVFGPGSIAHAHKPDEFISIDEYHHCIDGLIVAIANWCGVSN